MQNTNIENKALALFPHPTPIAEVMPSCKALAWRGWG